MASVQCSVLACESWGSGLFFLPPSSPHQVTDLLGFILILCIVLALYFSVGKILYRQAWVRIHIAVKYSVEKCKGMLVRWTIRSSDSHKWWLQGSPERIKGRPLAQDGCVLAWWHTSCMDPRKSGIESRKIYIYFIYSVRYETQSSTNKCWCLYRPHQCPSCAVPACGPRHLKFPTLGKVSKESTQKPPPEACSTDVFSLCW